VGEKIFSPNAQKKRILYPLFDEENYSSTLNPFSKAFWSMDFENLLPYNALKNEFWQGNQAKKSSHLTHKKVDFEPPVR
jgi:hypothetical protein